MCRYLFLFLLCNSAFAQNYNHFTNWSRLTIQKSLSDKWDIQAELHYRRQSNFQLSEYNPFAEPLMEGFRIGVHYSIGNMRYSFTPILVHSYPLIGNDDDFERPDRSEFRPALYAEWSSNAHGKWEFRSRLGYEYRLFKRTNGTWGDQQGRPRLRLQARYALSEQTTLLTSVEPLINALPNPAPNTFSQNQTYFGWNHDWSEHLTSEIGYFYIYRQRSSLIEFDHENVLNLVMIVRL